MTQVDCTIRGSSTGECCKNGANQSSRRCWMRVRRPSSITAMHSASTPNSSMIRGSIRRCLIRAKRTRSKAAMPNCETIWRDWHAARAASYVPRCLALCHQAVCLRLESAPVVQAGHPPISATSLISSTHDNYHLLPFARHAFFQTPRQSLSSAMRNSNESYDLRICFNKAGSRQTIHAQARCMMV